MPLRRFVVLDLGVAALATCIDVLVRLSHDAFTTLLPLEAFFGNALYAIPVLALIWLSVTAIRALLGRPIRQVRAEALIAVGAIAWGVGGIVLVPLALVLVIASPALPFFVRGAWARAVVLTAVDEAAREGRAISVPAGSLTWGADRVVVHGPYGYDRQKRLADRWLPCAYEMSLESAASNEGRMVVSMRAGKREVFAFGLPHCNIEERAGPALVALPNR